jgi:outer membrane lipoprotein SlyB
VVSPTIRDTKEDNDMNTRTPNTLGSTARGIPPGFWIGGGLMAVAIVALATTLVVKSNAALPGTASAATLPLVSPTTTPGDPTTQRSSMTDVGQPPVREATRAPVHHTATHNDNYSGNGYNEPQRVASVAVCATCGVIDSYSAVQVHGANNGVGAVAGGLGGALLGSKIAGRNDHTIGGVIGAVGGGLLGNAIESHERVATVYDVRVRMADGTIRTVRQSTVPNVGARVSVDGNTLRAIDGQG